MTEFMEHCDDKGMENCDDKFLSIVMRSPWSLVMTSLMENSDEKVHGAL